MSQENDYIMETNESSEKFQLKEIYYKCTECPSSIEILTMNEAECTIEFKCVNNNHKEKISIKDYIEKMQNFNYKNINNDECVIKDHNKNKYECYCLDCNKHLCKECLKSRNHIGHNKTNIIEIQPNQRELNIFENIIKSYEDKISNLVKDKFNKTKEMENKLKESENKLKEKNEFQSKENKNIYEKELSDLKDKYKRTIKRYRSFPKKF